MQLQERQLLERAATERAQPVKLRGLLAPEHLLTPLVLVDERRRDLRATRPARQSNATLLRELLAHGGPQRVQPLVLRLDLACQLVALGLAPGDVTLELQQG